MNQFEQIAVVLSFHQMMQSPQRRRPRGGKQGAARGSRLRRRVRATWGLLASSAAPVRRAVGAGVAWARTASPIKAMPGLPADEVAPQR